MTAFLTRVKFAFWTWFTILFSDRIPDEVAAALVPRMPAPATVAPAPERPVAVEPTAIAMLALLQRDGRLIDFLMEDIAPFADGQVGAAVREVHAGCRKALLAHVTLTPVVDAEEGGRMTVDAGTDAARVKVIGNVSGAPPFNGVVRHRGWLAARVDLPPLTASSRSVVAPAEVEVN